MVIGGLCFEFGQIWGNESNFTLIQFTLDQGRIISDPVGSSMIQKYHQWSRSFWKIQKQNSPGISWKCVKSFRVKNSFYLFYFRLYNIHPLFLYWTRWTYQEYPPLLGWHGLWISLIRIIMKHSCSMLRRQREIEF